MLNIVALSCKKGALAFCMFLLPFSIQLYSTLLRWGGQNSAQHFRCNHITDLHKGIITEVLHSISFLIVPNTECALFTGSKVMQV